MKFLLPVLIAFAASSSAYTPIEDVEDHARIALDTRDIVLSLRDGDTATAYNIYVNGKNRQSGGTLQDMAQKDWIASDVTDKSILTAYQTALGADTSSDDATEIMDEFNIDAIVCNGSMLGEAPVRCAVAGEKHMFCTMLTYALYEGQKSIDNGGLQKQWDELFAFWHGNYFTAEAAFGNNSPRLIQNSRDGNYDSVFRCGSLEAVNEGTAAIQASDATALQDAFDKFKAANVATFSAQAALRYAYLTETEDALGNDPDGFWAEGYAYFRCGVGLLTPSLAAAVNAKLDFRGTPAVPANFFCDVLDLFVAEAADLGQGITLSNLEVLNYIPDAETLCGLTAGTLAATELTFDCDSDFPVGGNCSCDWWDGFCWTLCIVFTIFDGIVGGFAFFFL